MDAMEKSHAFESAVVSTLFNTRQLVWTELSSVISGRQLQSFYDGRPTCSVCSTELAPMDLNRGKPFRKLSPPQDCTSRPSRTKQNQELRKRLRHSTSLSSMNSAATSVREAKSKPVASRWHVHNSSKPPQKRPCVRTSLLGLSVQPRVLLVDTQTLEETDYECTTTSLESPFDDRSHPETPVACQPSNQPSSPSPTKRAFEMGYLSPPTQQFDATLAIENAVNHQDLCLGDVTQLGDCSTTIATLDGTTDDQSSITLSTDVRQTSKFNFQRCPPLKNCPSHIANNLLHRRGTSNGHKKSHKAAVMISSVRRRDTIRYKPSKESRNAVVHDPDETGAELSLPSDFLDTERTEAVFKVPQLKVVMTRDDLSYRKTPVACQPSNLLPSPNRNRAAIEIDIFSPPSQQFDATLAIENAVNHQDLNLGDVTQLGECSTTTAAPDGVVDPPQSNQSEQSDGDKENCGHHHERRRTLVPSGGTTANKRSNEVKCVHPPERRKSARRHLAGHVCPDCKEYYETAGLSTPEIKKRIHRCSRHRAMHGAPPSTPKGFWDIDISDSEIPFVQPTNQQDETKRGGFRRRRPLNFPKISGSPTPLTETNSNIRKAV